MAAAGQTEASLGCAPAESLLYAALPKKPSGATRVRILGMQADVLQNRALSLRIGQMSADFGTKLTEIGPTPVEARTGPNLARIRPTHGDRILPKFGHNWSRSNFGLFAKFRPNRVDDHRSWPERRGILHGIGQCAANVDRIGRNSTLVEFEVCNTPFGKRN